jgi:hypothetical protein
MTDTPKKPSQQVLDRIRKLLAMTDESAGTTEGEVENAMRFARKLMDEYNLSEDQVRPPADDGRPDTAGIDREEGMTLRQWPVWMQNFALAVCRLCDVDMYWATSTYWRPADTVRPTGRQKTAVFVGYAVDIAIAREMLKYLLTVTRVMARQRYGNRWLSPHKSYALGFSETVYHRVVTLKREAAASTGEAEACTAIVLRKADNIKAWIEQNLTLRSPRKGGGTSGPTDPMAYVRGREDGKNVDLSTTNIMGG